MVGAQADVVGRLLVAEAHEPLGGTGGLVALGHDDADDLAAVGDVRRLQHAQLTLGLRQRRRVLPGEHVDDALLGQGGGGVDGGDARPGRWWTSRRP